MVTKKQSKALKASLKEAHDCIDAIATIEIDDEVIVECLNQIVFISNYMLGKALIDRQKSGEIVSFKLPKGIM